MYMKLADKHDAFENIGSFVRSVEHHFHLFLWIDATKRVMHTTCAETKFVVMYLSETSFKNCPQEKHF